MHYDTVDRGKIENMVRAFYAVVLKDDILAPFFVKALGDDLNNGKWYEHLHTLDNFWLLMMTGERGYMGDPFPPHVFIGPLYPQTFERWLKLFHETVNRLFIPDIADKFYKKAHVIALQFMENLGTNEENDED